MRKLMFFLAVYCIISPSFSQETNLFNHSQNHIAQILKKCDKHTENSLSDEEIKNTSIQEIKCKKKAIIEELHHMMPEEYRESAIKALNNYEQSYIMLYNTITNNNNYCNNEFGCGTMGQAMPYILFNQELSRLLEYTLQRQDGTF